MGIQPPTIPSSFPLTAVAAGMLAFRVSHFSSASQSTILVNIKHLSTVSKLVLPFVAHVPWCLFPPANIGWPNYKGQWANRAASLTSGRGAHALKPTVLGFSVCCLALQPQAHQNTWTTSSAEMASNNDVFLSSKSQGQSLFLLNSVSRILLI